MAVAEESCIILQFLMKAGNCMVVWAGVVSWQDWRWADFKISQEKTGKPILPRITTKRKRSVTILNVLCKYMKLTKMKDRVLWGNREIVWIFTVGFQRPETHRDCKYIFFSHELHHLCWWFMTATLNKLVIYLRLL